MGDFLVYLGPYSYLGHPLLSFFFGNCSSNQERDAWVQRKVVVSRKKGILFKVCKLPFYFFNRKNQEYLLKSLLKLVVLATKVLEYVYVKVLKIWLGLFFFFKTSCNFGQELQQCFVDEGKFKLNKFKIFLYFAYTLLYCSFPFL